MINRKYTAIVTITLVNPEGKYLGTKAEGVVLTLDMADFPEDSKEADKHMKSELGGMLAAGHFRKWEGTPD